MSIRIKLPRLHPGQLAVARDQARFNVLACGRRWGKTVFGIDRLVHPALHGFPVAWFAPSYKYLIEPWRELRRLLAPVTDSSNATERRIDLITGGSIEFWSLQDPDAGRSRKYKRIVIDEAAMARNLGEAWQAAIRATLADYEGDAFLLSTPKGRNFFWECWQRGQDPEQPEWKSWQTPTSTNPFIPASEIEAMRRQMPERIFQQEVLAMFLEDAGGVFRRVADAATATEQERALPGHEYVMGVDWGKLSDFTVISVVDTNLGEQVYLDRFNQIDYQVQLGRLEAVYNRFNPYQIVAERNSMGEPLIEQLQRRGLPVQAFQTTNQSKAQIIEALSLAFERGDLKILPDPVLIAELQAYEMERLPGGTFRYSAPEGMHDDTVMSLALAWHAANAYSDQLYIVTADGTS